jgi:hypothetical protein
MSRALVLMSIGGLALLAGLVWLVFVIVLAVGVDPLWWVPVGLLAGTLGLVGVALARLRWPPAVLELTDTGYRVRARGDVGVRSASWQEVESVETGQLAGSRALLVRLTSGERTTVPAVAVGESLDRLEREIHDRLNAAHGYRRLDDA